MGATTRTKRNKPADEPDLRKPAEEPIAGAAGGPDPDGEATAAVEGRLFAMISLPLGEADEKLYRPRRIDLHLTERQAEALKRIGEGLRGEPCDIDPQTGAWIVDGPCVDSPARTLRCLLNMVAQQIIASENSVDGATYAGDLGADELDAAGGSASSGDDVSESDGVE